MKAILVKDGCEVRRNDGKRARTLVHLWGMICNELNQSYAGEYTYCWQRMRLCDNDMARMPLALHKCSSNMLMLQRYSGEMLLDQNYATHNLCTLYNNGEVIYLVNHFIHEEIII